MNLPNEFTARMQKLLGEEYNAFLDSYAAPAVRALRVNTLKTGGYDDFSLFQFFMDTSGINRKNMRVAMDVICFDPSLPAGKTDGWISKGTDGHCHQGGRDLFTGTEQGIHFPGVTPAVDVHCLTDHFISGMSLPCGRNN